MKGNFEHRFWMVAGITCLALGGYNDDSIAVMCGCTLIILQTIDYNFQKLTKSNE